MPLQGHPCERQTRLVPVNAQPDAQASIAQIIQAQNEDDNEIDIPVYHADDDIFLSMLYIAMKLHGNTLT